MENKLQKKHLIYYNLLIATGLWQAHYDKIIENVKLVELQTKNATVFLNRMQSVYVVTKVKETIF